MPEFEFEGKRPNVHPDAYVAPTAVLIGDVEVQAGASIWFGATLRGDENRITVKEGADVQDHSMIHATYELPTVIEKNASVAHMCHLEGCVVEEDALVGSGAIMLNGSRLGKGAMLAAGSVLLENQEVPAGHLAAGVPAKVKKELSGSSARWVGDGGPAAHYQRAIHAYKRSLRPAD
jgi:carbonic anhydrase/acetyltransferase-like protein (isoleucine patch superfamily)